MKRWHLFEFMDFPWFPDSLRRIQTDILQELMTRTKAFDCAAPYIIKQLEQAQSNTVIDLCSGASGPWLRLIKQFSGKQVRLILTDKYPNLSRFQAIKERSGGKIDYIETPVDALRVDPGLRGVFTMFTGFHHFKPRDVRSIIQSCQQNRQTVCLFDYCPHKLANLLLAPFTNLISFLQFYFLVFLLRPYTWRHLLFTNLVPVVPLVAVWDGFVSGMRKYSAGELREIVAGLETPDYRITIGEDFTVARAVPMVYLLGEPVEVGGERGPF